jgi:hypothetical protein
VNLTRVVVVGSIPSIGSQALRRTARRIITRERLYAGNRETVRNALFDTDGILWSVIRTYGKRRRDLPELFGRPEYGHAAVIQLNSTSRHGLRALNSLHRVAR